MLRKTLVVGVGGTGGKTVRVLYQSLLRQLRASGWDKPELPECWQLLWIDTLNPQRPDHFPAPLMPESNYFSIVPGRNTGWQQIDSGMQTSFKVSADRKQALSSWFPETVMFDITGGAGACRTVGRAIAASQLGRIKGKLVEINKRLMSNEALADEQWLINKGICTAGAQGKPLVVLISSLAGGSGSGMFIDVAEAIKSVNPEFNSQTMLNILYGPDVFGSLKANSPHSVKMISQNVLGAVNELTRSAWSAAPAGGTELLFNRGQLTGIQQVDGLGPGVGGRYTFLIGAQTAGINGSPLPLGETNEIYQAVAESLTPLVGDENFQDQMASFLENNNYPNSGQAASTVDNTGLRLEVDKYILPFSALGFSRLSLGMDRFADYATEVLARESMEKLLWPHTQDVMLGGKNPQQKVADRVSALKDHFIQKSPINEEGRDGPQSNKIIERLRPDATSIIRGGISSIESAAGASPGSAEDWKIRLQGAMANNRSEIESELSKKLTDNAKAWVTKIQGELIDYVTASVVREGISVTSALVRELATKTEAVAKTEMFPDALDAQREAQSVGGKISAALANLGHILPNTTPVEKAMSAINLGFERTANFDLYNLTGNLMIDLAQNFLDPLADALDDAFTLLRMEASGDDFQSWPRWDRPVPDHLKPGVTEITLIKPAEYATTMKELAETDMGAGSQWQSLLIERVLTGKTSDGSVLQNKTDAIGETFINRDQSWSPKDAGISDGNSSSLQVSMPQRARDFRIRAGRVSRAENTTFGRFVATNLGSYLAASQESMPVRLQRSQKFQEALNHALARSAPLTALDLNFVRDVHGDPAGGIPQLPALIMSEVPQQIRDLALPNGDGSSIMAASLTSAGFPASVPSNPRVIDVKEITFFQALSQTAHPIVFDSLWAPIHESWTTIADREDIRMSWWRLRRAMPLADALPLSPEVLEWMMTGWFAGMFLHEISVDSSHPTRGPKVSIQAENGKGLDFPHPLLATVTPDAELDLPAFVLLSVSLATMFANVNRDLGQLDPYKRLRKLGENVKTDVKTWINDGVSPSGQEAPLESAEERKTDLVNQLEEAEKRYSQLFSDADASEVIFGHPQIWELRDVVNKAFADIRAAVERA